MPTSYLPDEDQGILMVQALLSGGSTLEQTEQVMGQVRDYFLDNEKDAVESVMLVSGRNFSMRAETPHVIYQAQGLNLRRPDPEIDRHCRKGHGGLFPDP
ncbi:MAG: efflux RND transporter permease subunit [Desulfobacterales bacterium]